jgi:hypothetical protein
MTATLAHEIAWVAAAPLWKEATKTPQVLRRPTILGFGHDKFMEELLAKLAQTPESIADNVATGASRSYRERLPGEAFDATPLVGSGQLKLYQPVHGWFYLVTGSLVCQLPGLPDHPVDPGMGETAGFVVRRISGASELALVAAADGTKSWQSATADALTLNEDVQPMFPLGFLESTRRRKLLAGLLPAGSQDALLAAPIGTVPDDDAQPPASVAFEAVKARVTRAITSLQNPLPSPAPQPGADQEREISRFILLDLADFLTFYLSNVMQALSSGAALTGKAAALLTYLRSHRVDPAAGTQSFADVLKNILNPLDLTTPFGFDLRNTDADPTDLENAISAAVLDAAPDALTVVEEVQQPGSTTFIARLVYQRPLCNPLKPVLLSPPSEPFLFAPYFDPEAPSRPIRIALPFDTSVAGLRKFRKSVKMVLSQALKQKVSLGTINSSVPGPSLDCGAFELSIPIITIVAMIILFVFIMLLNIVFFWLPFVKICLPGLSVDLGGDE